jgi:hypothetical protein
VLGRVRVQDMLLGRVRQELRGLRMKIKTRIKTGRGGCHRPA